MIVPELIYNLSLLAVLCVLSNFLDEWVDKHHLLGQFFQGLLFGFIALVGMIYPFYFVEGVFFDGRTVVVSIGTVFFGPFAGAVSLLIASIFRIAAGGGGMVMGMMSLIYAFIIGWVFFLMRKNNPDGIINIKQLISLGILVHFMMAVFIYVLPSQHVMKAFQTVAITIMVVYPLATVLVGKMMSMHEERMLTHRRLLEKEHKFQMLTKSSEDIIFTIDRNLRYTGVYGSWPDIYGLGEKEIIGRKVIDIHSSEKDRFQKERYLEALNGRVVVYESELTGINGPLYFQTKLSPIRNEKQTIIGMVGIGRNITEIKKMQLELAGSLKEKNVLLAEIHHRVKNNMAIVSSLLNLQSDYAVEEETRVMFKDTENRVRSMALVHEVVYERDNFTDIDMKSLLEKLVSLLSQSCNLPQHNISTSVDSEEILLDMNTSVPCSLLVNELFTNAWKHAFHIKKEGHIFVRFYKVKDKYELCVGDNGGGIHDLDKLNRPESFGYSIIQGLVKQIRGEIRYDNSGKGLQVYVRF